MNLGLAFAHLVEMRRKREKPGLDWLMAQKADRDFGKTAALAAIEEPPPRQCAKE